MAHGWRRRAAAFGAAAAVCTGLGGCTTEDKKPLTPPTAKGSTFTPPASVRTTPPPTTGTGVGPTGGFGSAGGATSYPTPPTPRPQPGLNTLPGANPQNGGAMGVPTVPGNYGPGAPLPGSPGLGVGPQTGSQYSPVGASSALPTPPSQPFGSSGNFGAPPAAAVRPPVTGTRPGDPPAPQLLDVPMPPPAPPVGGLNPNVGPTTDGFPAAPPYPTSPPAALPNAPFPVPPSR